MILMSCEPNGSVGMSIESIVQLAQRTAQSNPEVRSMSCRVRSHCCDDEIATLRSQ